MLKISANDDIQENLHSKQSFSLQETKMFFVADWALAMANTSAHFTFVTLT
jgi:hypothetical protein